MTATMAAGLATSCEEKDNTEPDKPVFGNYIRSRRIMGAALLVLSANYMVHLLLRPCFTAPDAAILMNLSTYYISAWLFSSALTSLLDSRYLTRRRFTLHIISWLCFTTAAGAVMILFPSGKLNTVGIIALALWFLIYAFSLASRLIRKYRKAVRLFDETQSDDISSYIDWLSLFTWWAVIYGIGCGLFNLACGLGKKFCCFRHLRWQPSIYALSGILTAHISAGMSPYVFLLG